MLWLLVVWYTCVFYWWRVKPITIYHKLKFSLKIIYHKNHIISWLRGFLFNRTTLPLRCLKTFSSHLQSPGARKSGCQPWVCVKVTEKNLEFGQTGVSICVGVCVRCAIRGELGLLNIKTLPHEWWCKWSPHNIQVYFWADEIYICFKGFYFVGNLPLELKLRGDVVWVRWDICRKARFGKAK